MVVGWWVREMRGQGGIGAKIPKPSHCWKQKWRVIGMVVGGAYKVTVVMGWCICKHKVVGGFGAKNPKLSCMAWFRAAFGQQEVERDSVKSQNPLLW